MKLVGIYFSFYVFCFVYSLTCSLSFFVAIVFNSFVFFLTYSGVFVINCDR